MASTKHISARPQSPEGLASRLDSAALVLAGLGLLLLFLGVPAALLALSLLLLAVAFALQPAFSLAIIAFVLPFYLIPRQFGSMAFSMPELVLVAAIAGGGARIIALRLKGRSIQWQRLSTPLDLPVALFLAAALLSLLATEVLRVSLRDLRTLVVEPAVAFYLAALLLDNKRSRDMLFGGLLLGAAAASAMGLYQFLFTDNVITAEGTRRILGPYLSPNHLGLYLGRIVPMALAAALFVPRLRIPGLLLVGLLVAALILTYSLGAWLACLVAVAAVIALWKPRALRWFTAAAVAGIAASVPLLSVERISSHFDFQHGTSFFRVQLWEASINMVRDHPLFGVGLDNFLYHYRSQYMLPDAAAEPNLSHPHNLILNFWLQMGILGVVAILWLLAALARSWWDAWRFTTDQATKALLAGIAGATLDFLTHGLVDNSYFLVDLSFFFWLSAAAIVTVSRSAATLSPNRRIE